MSATAIKRVRRRLNRETVQVGLLELAAICGYHLTRVTAKERRFHRRGFDDSVPLPLGAEEELRPTNPRLLELREAYDRLNLPASLHSQWNSDYVERRLRLAHFRGDNAYTWLYRQNFRVSELLYFVFAQYVRERDPRGLIQQLGEDGKFGCWTFEYETYGKVSRDLLDSVNEICFLDRAMGLFDRPDLRVLDIGAGYGRLAHRMHQALPHLAHYWCTDAIPESTFLCECYLRYRGCTDRATVVPLDQFPRALEGERLDLAVNIHSFAECRYDAIAWWVEQVRRLEVPHFLIVPNHADRLLSIEPDGRRRDFRPLVEDAGYRLAASEPVYVDPAVRQMIGIDDHMMLFELAS